MKIKCNLSWSRVSFIDMKKSLYLSFVLLLLCVAGVGQSFAQLAYDSACYFPRINNPADFDTIYGSSAHQHLGELLGTMPPLKGQPYGRLLFSVKGTINDAPDNLTSFETGPTFDLHHLKKIKKYSFEFPFWPGYVRYGHFRNSSSVDMMVYDGGYGAHPIIYWADENGDYDSSRTTQFIPNQLGPYGTPAGNMSVYVDHFSSDTVEDVVFGMELTHFKIKPDSVFMFYVKGGQQLYDKGRIAMWDDSAYWDNKYYNQSGAVDSTMRFRVQGDFRGTGRQDLITMDGYGNLYFFRNDPPFDLHRFVRSIQEDTLLVMRDYSLGGPLGPNDSYLTLNLLSLAAFPKKSGDRSVDFAIAPKTHKDPNYHRGIYLFQGGPHFGEKRIGYDSSDFLIRHPSYYGLGVVLDWPTMANLGDITGTGNTVLITGGGIGLGTGFIGMYVLGKALDDKIDLFIPYYHGAGWWTTMRATANDIPSFIKSTTVANSDEDEAKGKQQVGGIQLLKGASKIPVRLNPLFSVAGATPTDATVTVYPNPVSKWFNISFRSSYDETVEYTLRDILGRTVDHQSRRVIEGAQTQHIDLPPLSAGEYIIEFSGSHTLLHGKVFVY